IVGSLLAPSGFDFATYHNQEVTLQGYALYLSGSTTHYFNILVKDVSVATTSSVFDLTILEVNDLHGYIEQDDDGTGGISNMAYLIDQIRADNPLDDVVLIANGDMFQGTAISNMTYGLAVIECMNMMDFDVMGIGNHEFDWTIENILAYFDGDESNGEADFPLLNANIYLLADDMLLTVIDGNMFTYTIIEREGVQIGVISYVGNIYYSISQVVVADYYFDLDIAGSVTTIANDLRDAGVDIVIVNIHDGDSSGVEYYSVNNQLAQLKATDGTYLVDAVINGHTHSYQTGSISRTNGVAMPVVQAGGKGNAFGEIVLTIDTDTMTVTASTVQLVYVDTAGTNHDTEIENYITNLKEELGNETLAVAGETISNTEELEDWVGNVMMASTGAQVAISNHGGIRATGGITAGEDVTLSQMYEISPFDNKLIVMELSYEFIMSFTSSSALFY
ncbi:MAG TPA: metallophosphoesterase, partial [Bacillota bacterium]|nr:metallophosphoesterase [Bacillota bacterium]